ncbi:sulfite exporter TauE/SafE family protein [Flavobacterium hiemivividum]|uniref:Probable membrane transporter protein n=1 Tax=Flavobacterium hiemivividum TaxID=2541734 RepID=A0A4R5D0A2_9FLAO|nr:sulfite exporter TauE/SafE family protein [Flavobacterium hiemivividum]TDE05627.1 sulfite exporter TauE/SafE family protein [Flavobacterium hiemivividum]
MDTPILVLTIGIFTGFFIQTIIGFAGALIALPFLLFVMPLSEAVGYISIFYLISTPIYVYKEWEHIDKNLVKNLALSSFVGIIVGIIVLTYGKPIFLKKALGLFIILFVLNSLKVKKEFQIMNKMKHVFGFMGGFFSGLFATGGPLYVMIVKNETADVKTFRATMFASLGLVTVMRIPVLALGGFLTLSQVYNSLYVLPFFILALFLGKKVYLKLDEVLLKKIILGLLFISGIALLIGS